MRRGRRERILMLMVVVQQRCVDGLEHGARRFVEYLTTHLRASLPRPDPMGRAVRRYPIQFCRSASINVSTRRTPKELKRSIWFGLTTHRRAHGEKLTRRKQNIDGRRVDLGLWFCAICKFRGRRLTPLAVSVYSKLVQNLNATDESLRSIRLSWKRSNSIFKPISKFWKSFLGK